MWSDYLALMVMAALLRLSHELARPGPGPSLLREADPSAIDLTPQQKEWAEKAIREYAAVQERKWRRWNEAMFEKV